MTPKAQDVITTVSVFALLIMFAVSLMTIGGRLLLTQESVVMAGHEYRYSEVVVEPGDTLWSIARAWVPDEDPRAVIGIIRELNQLSSADIYPGQVLAVYQKTNIQPLQVADSSKL